MKFNAKFFHNAKCESNVLITHKAITFLTSKGDGHYIVERSKYDVLSLNVCGEINMLEFHSVSVEHDKLKRGHH